MTTYSLRDSMKVQQQHFNTMKYGFNSLKYQGAKIYNDLPLAIKQCDTTRDFKNAIKTWDGPKCQCGMCILCQSRIRR